MDVIYECNLTSLLVWIVWKEKLNQLQSPWRNTLNTSCVCWLSPWAWAQPIRPVVCLQSLGNSRDLWRRQQTLATNKSMLHIWCSEWCSFGLTVSRNRWVVMSTFNKMKKRNTNIQDSKNIHTHTELSSENFLPIFWAMMENILSH